MEESILTNTRTPYVKDVMVWAVRERELNASAKQKMLLAALYFGKDLVRDSSAVPGLQQPQSATTSGASVSNSSTAHQN